MATVFLLVGLPASGKTTRALQLARQERALRLTPDEWMIPLFGDSDADGKRDVLEGRLIAIALDALALGTNVVLDFGLWSSDERWALRSLARSLPAESRVIYLPVDEVTQARRTARRWSAAPETTFEVTAEDAALWRAAFQEPTQAEVDATQEIDPPLPWRSWREWSRARWPSLTA